MDTPATKPPKKTRGKARRGAERIENGTLPARMAAAAGLLDGRKTKHINAKVPPALFAAAAKRVGSTSPAAVVEAALAALATQDNLGPWLAEQWGTLAEVDPALLTETEF